MSSESESDPPCACPMSDPENDQDSDSSASSSTDDAVASRLRSKMKKPKVWCVKLTLPEHLAAYMEERDLDRHVEPVQCSAEVIEKIFSNYLIAKNILRHLQWQEKLICQDVCPLWNSAIKRLQIEQLEPVDFSVNASFQTTKDGVMLKSSEFYTEPMVVFTMCSHMAYNVCSIACKYFNPKPCIPPCDEEHSILDIIHHQTTSPRDCMYTIKANSVSYMPLPYAITAGNTIKKPILGSANFYGICIPTIPGVEFKMLNIDSLDNTQEHLVPELKKLTEKYVVKGIVGCLTENYLLYTNDSNTNCLEFLNAIQPDKPFAFGGCLVEDTATEIQDIVGVVDSINKAKEFVSGNMMSLGIFLTPKEVPATVESRHHFEIYSFVLESSEWNRIDILQAVQEFSESIPKFEHSALLKFSCLGRTHKHEIEQHCFRLYFPDTPQVGCFGNGELGVNQPRRQPRPNSKNNTAKRPREYHAYEKVHSYSTVFFYIGWGKILEETGEN